MADVLNFLQSPLGAAALVLLYLFVPQAKAFLAPLLARLKPSSPSDPKPDPNAPVPKTPDLIDAALLALKAIAKKRFPWLTPEQAMFKMAGSLHEEDELAEMKRAIEATKESPV